MKEENIFKLAIVVIGIISIILNFMLFQDWRGIFYYTIISNLYVVGFYLVTLILNVKKKLVKNDTYYMSKGLMLLMIICTMLIYNLIVASNNNIYTGHPIECYSVHLLIPILATIECLCFENKGVLKYKFIPKWVLSCIVYSAIILIYRLGFNGTFLEGKSFPYDMVNYEIVGVARSIINALGTIIAFALVGAIIVYIDNKMKKPLAGGKKHGR